MNEKNLKNISVEVSNDCWKKIKIMAIQKEVSFQEQVRELLEKSVSRKNFDDIVSS